MSERLPKPVVADSLRGRAGQQPSRQVVMKGPGCRPGEQPKNPADKPPAGWARTLAFPGERGVHTVSTWFFTDGAATSAAAVSYTERRVVLRLDSDGDPDEDTIPLPEALGIDSAIPGTRLPPPDAAWPVGLRSGQCLGNHLATAPGE
nr:hypothetical protein [Streptomyces sp. S1D4-11]QIY92965.1 hypothetical protein HEP87_00220 [Streptomyces sp. S1D4-11]